MLSTLPVLAIALFGAVSDERTATGDAERIDALVQEQMHAPGAAALSVAVGRGGEVVFSKGYGSADLEFAAPANEETMFRIGSITKQFTAAAVLLLAEREKLCVDDPLSRFLPGYAHGDEITLRHLLTHTSGVPSYTDFGPEWEKIVARELSNDEMLALWKERPLDFEPGSRWRYSNSGYFLLGVVIEKASGQSYADFLRTQLFEPLGLTRTRYDSNGEVLLNRAQGYGFEDGKFWNDRLIGMSQPGAAGGLISTAGDLVRWEMALVSGKVVKPASYEEMTLPFLLNDGHETTYGMGLSLEPFAGKPAISHGGGIFGFNSFLAYLPESGLTVAVISSSEGLSAQAVADRLARALSSGG